MNPGSGSEDDMHRRSYGALLSDPSPLTTAQLLREISSLKELTEQQMDSFKEAIDVAHEDLVRVPTAVQEAVGSLKELVDAKLETHLEKFAGIQTQFKELNIRIEQTAKDAKTAIDAALLAAEKAVGKQQEANAAASQKSDASFTKQIDQQAMLMGSIKSELDSRITDVKDRFTAFQGTAQGRSAQHGDQQQSTSLWVAIGGLVLGLLGFVAGFVLNK